VTTLIFTWAALKTALEGSPSPGDRFIIAAPLTVTSTITPAANGSSGSPIIIEGASWNHRPLITGGTDTASFQISGRSYLTFRNLIQEGGANFAKFSGTCVGVEIVHVKGSEWDHSTSSMAQFIEAGGGSRTGCRIAFCEGSDSDWDFFSTAGSYGWVCEFNWVHDIGDDAENGNTDAFACHDSSGGYSTFRYNLVERVAGKSGIQFGTNASVGSKGYAYGNVVIDCRRGITADGSAPDALIYSNIVVMSATIAAGEAATYGIGSLCGDSSNGLIRAFNNLVINRSGAAECYGMRFDTVFQSVNNVIVTTNSTARFYYISAGSTGYANVLADNHYWSTDGTEGSRIRLGAALVNLAGIQGLGGEVGTTFEDPEFRTVPTLARQHAIPLPSSPLLGTGTDLSAVFATDIVGRVHSVWSKGPWAAGAPASRRATFVLVQAIRDAIVASVR